MIIDNTKEIRTLISNLENLDTHERLSALEGGLEDMVNTFRDKLNKNILDKINIEQTTKEKNSKQNTEPLIVQHGKKKPYF